MNDNLHTMLKDRQKGHIFDVLCKYKWNKPKTAEALGIGLSSLYRKIKELNIRK